MESIQDLLGSHRPQFAGAWKQPGEFGQVDGVVAAQKTTTGLAISAAPAFAAWVKAMKAMVLIW